MRHVTEFTVTFGHLLNKQLLAWSGHKKIYTLKKGSSYLKVLNHTSVTYTQRTLLKDESKLLRVTQSQSGPITSLPVMRVDRQSIGRAKSSLGHMQLAYQ